jgi:hypothetical protein
VNFAEITVKIPCAVNITYKLSLIHEKNVRQNLYIWLQPFTKPHTVGVITSQNIVLLRVETDKNHHQPPP